MMTVATAREAMTEGLLRMLGEVLRLLAWARCWRTTVTAEPAGSFCQDCSGTRRGCVEGRLCYHGGLLASCPHAGKHLWLCCLLVGALMAG